METREELRIVSAAHGCGRCESAERKDGLRPDGNLLLAAQNGHAAASLARALESADLAFTRWGGAFVLPGVRPRLDRLQAALDAHVLLPARRDIRGVFFAGDLRDQLAGSLDALLQTEPLPVLLARIEHEWVRDALEDNWLTSFFQPIVSARDGTVFAYEALLRARQPETGALIAAPTILEACEQLCLQHVLDQRARQCAIREAAALPNTDARVFINFLPNTIYDPEICLRTTMEAAQTHGVPLSRLVFEVVETESIPDIVRLQRILDYYRSQGVGTAVDDMGAGFSSMEYLSRLRPDFVKIDRALIARAATGEAAARQQLDAIITHAHALNGRVIAEGIETREQLRLCQEAGADLLQGYLFARPASPPERVNTAPFVTNEERQAA